MHSYPQAGTMTTTDHAANAAATWARCRELIRASVSADSYSSWFADTRALSYDGDTLVLQIASDFVKQLYEKHFCYELGKALTEVYGPDVRLLYEIGIVQDDASSSVRVSGVSPSEAPLPPQGGAAPQSVEEVDDTLVSLNSYYTFDNYCVGESNRLPYTIARSIADHPERNDFNPFFLYGSVGVGKTHLVQAIARRIHSTRPRARICYESMRNFQNQYVIAQLKGKVPDFINYFQSIDVLLIDDLQELSGKRGTIDTLFPIFNYLHNSGRKLIFTCDRPPVNLEGIADRLIDRFKWGATEQLHRPDLELRKSILRRKAMAGGLELPDDVVDVIARNVEGSVRELEGVVAALISRSVFLSIPITKELALEIARKQARPRARSINFDMIVETTAEWYHISPDVIFSKSRVRDIAEARQVIMYMASKLLGLSRTAIGGKLKRAHSTVLHGVQAVADRLPIDRDMAEAVSWIESALNR